MFKLVITESRFTDGHCWRDVLLETQGLVPSPQLIVTERSADGALWAEVLNLGGYDLLSTPFDAEEVLRVVAMALRPFPVWVNQADFDPAFDTPHAHGYRDVVPILQCHGNLSRRQEDLRRVPL